MNLEKIIFDINNEKSFNDIALEIFNFQYNNCSVYMNFVDSLKINVSDVNNIYNIPFLPISFFKSHKIISGDKNYHTIFVSSGTTSTMRSKHFVKDVFLYEDSFTNCFQNFYGNIEDYCIMALLPSHVERENSSLVYMVRHLIKLSKNKQSGFYLSNKKEMISKLKQINYNERN